MSILMFLNLMLLTQMRVSMCKEGDAHCTFTSSSNCLGLNGGGDFVTQQCHKDLGRPARQCPLRSPSRGGCCHAQNLE